MTPEEWLREFARTAREITGAMDRIAQKLDEVIRLLQDKERRPPWE